MQKRKVCTVQKEKGALQEKEILIFVFFQRKTKMAKWQANPAFRETRKYEKSGKYTKAAKEAARMRRVLARGRKAAKHAAYAVKQKEHGCGTGRHWRKAHTRKGKSIPGKCVSSWRKLKPIL